jgi:peroxiredoxin
VAAAVVLLAGAATWSCASAGAGGSGASTPPAGAKLADFSLETVEGKSVALSDHVGKHVVLMTFWATWCEPCLAEMPHLASLHDKHKGKGFTVLSINMDGPETVAEVRAYVQRNRLPFPVLLDQESRAVSLYNPRRAAPFGVLIGREGTVLKKRDGYVPGDEVSIEADVVAALAGR